MMVQKHSLNSGILGMREERQRIEVKCTVWCSLFKTLSFFDPWISRSFVLQMFIWKIKLVGELKRTMGCNLFRWLSLFLPICITNIFRFEVLYPCIFSIHDAFWCDAKHDVFDVKRSRFSETLQIVENFKISPNQTRQQTQRTTQ